MIVSNADFALKDPEAGWEKNSRPFALSIKVSLYRHSIGCRVSFKCHLFNFSINTWII